MIHMPRDVNLSMSIREYELELRETQMPKCAACVFAASLQYV